MKKEYIGISALGRSSVVSTVGVSAEGLSVLDSSAEGLSGLDSSAEGSSAQRRFYVAPSLNEVLVSTEGIMTTMSGDIEGFTDSELGLFGGDLDLVDIPLDLGPAGALL